MSADQTKPAGPDLTQGIDGDQVRDGAMLIGHVGEDPVLLARSGDEIFAVGASCTHYGGPLVEGLVVGDTVRCPWHHACFSLRTGEAIRAPALNDIACYAVETRDGRLFVHAARANVFQKTQPPNTPSSVVIIGGGAAAQAALETLRRERYRGPITLLSADGDAPCDRPNLSKDYLAGTASDDWIPLRDATFYQQHAIDLCLGARVTAIDTGQRLVRTQDGNTVPFGALLIATGAEPIRLDVPGATLPHVHYLRSLADCRSLIETAGRAKRAVVIGASFIGLEVAASLRSRRLEVDVVAPERIPMERIMGPEIGSLVRAVHEEHGVRFHLPDKVQSISEHSVRLESGARIDAELVVVGIGVKPALDLAEKAGLTTDRGIAVDAHLRTSVPGVFAAGDVARWPDPHSGKKIRVEHWVVAERQGQVAALNMLGREQPFVAVPFFWSMHYDMPILYVGHSEGWNSLTVDGSIEQRDCHVTVVRSGRTCAVATIGRDLDSLRAERELELLHPGQPRPKR
jgi:NADPH-dependent 2,4-dienoyl-CoA reductase/sulfur reductase-like enzyme/nitrite reductase/ring-hydroxylating ferredoxin subunit